MFPSSNLEFFNRMGWAGLACDVLDQSQCNIYVLSRMGSKRVYVVFCGQDLGVAIRPVLVQTTGGSKLDRIMVQIRFPF